MLLCLLLALGCGSEGSSAERQAPPPDDTPRERAGGANDMVGKKVSARKRKSRYDDAELLVQISFTEGERGRNERALQTHITVVDDQLFISESTHGRRALGSKPNSNKIELSPAERKKIEQAILDLALFDIGTIEIDKVPDQSHQYAAVAVKLRLKGKEHRFSLAGVTSLPPDGRTAFAETAGFRAVERMVGELRGLARMELK